MVTVEEDKEEMRGEFEAGERARHRGLSRLYGLEECHVLDH